MEEQTVSKLIFAIPDSVTAIELYFTALTSWYVDAARRRLHEAVGNLLVVGIGEGGIGVVGALLRVAGVEVVDLVTRQVRLAQLQRRAHRRRRRRRRGITAHVAEQTVSAADSAAEEAGVPAADPVERAACKSRENIQVSLEGRKTTVSLGD